jgi:predicted ribosome-associated RNA-binding protein Tma20
MQVKELRSILSQFEDDDIVMISDRTRESQVAVGISEVDFVERLNAVLISGE